MISWYRTIRGHVWPNTSCTIDLIQTPKFFDLHGHTIGALSLHYRWNGFCERPTTNSFHKVVTDGSVINLHVRVKLWNLVDKFMWPYYLIKSMEALWEINASAKSNMAATGLCVKGECDSLTGSYLISLLITAACSNLNEESRVSHEPTLASRGVTWVNCTPHIILRADTCYFDNQTAN